MHFVSAGEMSNSCRRKRSDRIGSLIRDFREAPPRPKQERDRMHAAKLHWSGEYCAPFVPRYMRFIQQALSAGSPVDQATPEAKQQPNAAYGRRQHPETIFQPGGELRDGPLQCVYGLKANAQAGHVTRAPLLEQQNLRQVLLVTPLNKYMLMFLFSPRKLWFHPGMCSFRMSNNHHRLQPMKIFCKLGAANGIRYVLAFVTCFSDACKLGLCHCPNASDALSVTSSFMKFFSQIASSNFMIQRLLKYLKGIKSAKLRLELIELLWH